MNLHTYTRPIWITRAATAADASEGEVTLSAAGDDYAAALAEWVAERVSDAQPLLVWTSTMKRAIQVLRVYLFFVTHLNADCTLCPSLEDEVAPAGRNGHGRSRGNEHRRYRI